MPGQSDNRVSISFLMTGYKMALSSPSGALGWLSKGRQTRGMVGHYLRQCYYTTMGWLQLPQSIRIRGRQGWAHLVVGCLLTTETGLDNQPWINIDQILGLCRWRFTRIMIQLEAYFVAKSCFLIAVFAIVVI